MSWIDTPEASSESRDKNNEELAEKVVALEWTVVEQQQTILDLEWQIDWKQDRPVRMWGWIVWSQSTLNPAKIKRVDMSTFSRPKRRHMDSKRPKVWGIVNKVDTIIWWKDRSWIVSNSIIWRKK